MKRNITVFLGAMIALLCLHSTSSAQDKEGEISVSITKEINGEKKTFERTYNSVEEMKSDKEYQDFAGEDDISWFSIGDDLEKEIVVKIDSNTDGDFTIATSGDEDVRIMKLDDLTEEVGNIEVEIKKVMESIDEESISQLKTIVKKLDYEDDILIATGDSEMDISISDLEKSDFGKSALTSPNEELDAEDLKLKIFGDQLIVKLTIEESSSVKVSLTDKAGEDLFVSRVLEAEKNISQVIDLSQYKSGDYLLEVKVDDNRLTKKVSVKGKE